MRLLRCLIISNVFAKLRPPLLSAQTAQNAETATFAFNNFALNHDDPAEETPSSKQDSKLGPGEDLHPGSYNLTGLAAQLQVAKYNSNTPVGIPMLHMEFNPNLVNWVETSPKYCILANMP